MKMFVYQHMDSRGGTTGVIAETREEADRKYLKFFGWDEFVIEGESTAADEDFSFIANMEGPVRIGCDNDDGDETTVLIERRLIDGEYDDQEESEEGELCLHHLTEDEVVQLRVAPANKPYPAGFGHVRWDDDAFNFIIIKEPTGIYEDAGRV